MHWPLAVIVVLMLISVGIGLYGIYVCEREWRAEQNSSRVTDEIPQTTDDGSAHT